MEMKFILLIALLTLLIVVAIMLSLGIITGRFESTNDSSWTNPTPVKDKPSDSHLESVADMLREQFVASEFWDRFQALPCQTQKQFIIDELESEQVESVYSEYADDLLGFLSKRSYVEKVQ